MVQLMFIASLALARLFFGEFSKLEINLLDILFKTTCSESSIFLASVVHLASSLSSVNQRGLLALISPSIRKS